MKLMADIIIFMLNIIFFHGNFLSRLLLVQIPIEFFLILIIVETGIFSDYCFKPQFFLC